MAQHTPGPWKLVGQYRTDEIRLRIDGPNGYVALTEPYNGDNKEIVANAHLIKAAPDLLAALESLLTVTELNLDELESDTVLKIHTALKAIARTKGES